MIQRTPEWYAARCGKVTASRVVDVITKLKNGAWGAPRIKYIDQLVAERLTGRVIDKLRNVRSIQERLELEPEARAAYSYFTDNDVEEAGFIQHPTIEMFGASPDGLIGKDGGLEIKVLDADTHIRLLRGDDSVIFDYLPQMHSGMACAGRKWWDFFSYSPDMPGALKGFRRRITRDEACVAGIEDGVRLFLGEVEAVMALCQKAA